MATKKASTPTKQKEPAVDFLDVESAIIAIREGVATLYLVSDGLDQDDEAKAACRFIADHMRPAAKKLEKWFYAEGAVRGVKGGDA